MQAGLFSFFTSNVKKKSILIQINSKAEHIERGNSQS